MASQIRYYFAIGMTERRRINLLQQEGVKRVLFSFADFRDAKPSDLSSFPEVLIDSGAFSTAKSGTEISINAYSLWLRIYLKDLPNVVGYFVYDDLASWEKTKQNQLVMEGEGLRPIPVYHYGEPSHVLDYYCERYGYVGLGGLAVGQVRAEALKIFWEWVCAKYPDTHFHILGSSQFKAFTRYQPYSVDSSTWLTDVWGNLLTLDSDGQPTWNGLPLQRSDGVTNFFNTDEIRAHNVRDLLHLEKMEWVKDSQIDQRRLL